MSQEVTKTVPAALRIPGRWVGIILKLGLFTLVIINLWPLLVGLSALSSGYLLRTSIEMLLPAWSFEASIASLIVIFFFVWLFYARKNLSFLGEKAEYSWLTTYIWWFVPIASLILPYKVIKNIASLSQPEKDKKLPMLFPIWWALFLSMSAAEIALSNALTLWVSKYNQEMSGHSVAGSLVNSDKFVSWLIIISALTTIAASISIWQVTNWITFNQQRKSSVVSLGNAR